MGSREILQGRIVSYPSRDDRLRHYSDLQLPPNCLGGVAEQVATAASLPKGRVSAPSASHGFSQQQSVAHGSSASLASAVGDGGGAAEAAASAEGMSVEMEVKVEAASEPHKGVAALSGGCRGASSQQDEVLESPALSKAGGSALGEAEQCLVPHLSVPGEWRKDSTEKARMSQSTFPASESFWSPSLPVGSRHSSPEGVARAPSEAGSIAAEEKAQQPKSRKARIHIFPSWTLHSFP